MSGWWMFVLLGLGLAAPALAADRPAPVSRAAELRAADTAGVVGYMAQADMRIEAPMMNRHTTWKAWVVTRDGKPVDTHVLAMTTDGKAASAGERGKLQAQINESQRKDPDGMDLPLDRRHLGSYVFAATSCQGCEPGAQAFTFRGTVRDQRHGDGHLELGKDGRFRKLSFRPCANPPTTRIRRGMEVCAPSSTSSRPLPSATSAPGPLNSAWASGPSLKQPLGSGAGPHCSEQASRGGQTAPSPA